MLRRVQFQTISRIDSLVDMIYEEFKNEYYPSEAVTVEVAGGDRLHGTVRDKTRFGARSLPDGTLVPSFSRYFVSLTNRPDEEAVVDDRHISRDRRIFTKSVLRSFIKKTVTREAWNGAPWLVKPDVAEYYHIDTRVPPHLRYDNKLLERKQLQAQKRLSQGDMVNGHAGPFSGSGQVRLPELKPAPRSHKSKAHQAAQLAQMPPGPGVVIKGKHHTFVGPQPGQFMHLPSPGNPFQLNLSGRHSIPPPPLFTQPEPAAPAVPPPPKYPIEDLQLEPRAVPRPLLQYACSDPPVPVEQGSPFGKNILMKSVGPLLETWDTLNVYCEILSLDSFTFDDYVEALQIASDETPVQLFDEVHCSVLKILVNAEAEDGKVQVQLPELDDGEEEEEGEDAGALPSPEPEPQPKGRATRSSLAKLEAERIAAEAAAAEKEMQGAAEAPKHRAEELLKDFDWIDQLRKREFKDGGWVRIMAGLLHQLSKKDRLKAKCEELLQHLVPDDVAPTAETARRHYMGMDINLRVQALQIMCILTAETKALRGYMENCSEEMTGLRKEKIELQRKRKQA